MMEFLHSWVLKPEYLPAWLQAGAAIVALALLRCRGATEYHKVAGRDPAKMPPMMKAADVVAASLAALKQGEVVCIPGLDDPALIGNFAELRRTILMKANRPALAQRYL
jgi:short-subunit dehydrogenase